MAGSCSRADDGTGAEPKLRPRIGSGQIGGVVLYGDNYGPNGPTLLIRQLQRAAAQGGQPRLLIAIDQEGGGVKRLAGPPTVAPSEMTTAAVAQAQGRETARNLRGYGIDVDFAPVLDVGHGGFIAGAPSATRPPKSRRVPSRSRTASRSAASSRRRSTFPASATRRRTRTRRARSSARARRG